MDQDTPEIPKDDSLAHAIDKPKKSLGSQASSRASQDQPQANKTEPSAELPIDPTLPSLGKNSDAIGWMFSLILHAIFIALIATLTLPNLIRPPVPSLTSIPDESESLDESQDLSAELELLDLTDAVPNESLQQEEIAEIAPDPVGATGALTPTLSDPISLDTSALTSPILSDLAGLVGEGTVGRSGEAREALVASKGGTPASELAVARGLKWIAEHQNPDGTWSLLHHLGNCRGRCPNPSSLGNDLEAFNESLASGTGLALLPFLGAGETHLKGRYRKTIQKGLQALVLLGQREKDRPGASWVDSGRLYSHGICAIVLAEAYGMTGDPDLRAPAQAAIDFIAYAQDPKGGGWRYTPQSQGDTSVTGWHLMALKSASLAKLETNKRTTDRASRFLDSVQVRNGERYRYLPVREDQKEGNGSRSLTAVALLSRMYLGWNQSNERLIQGMTWATGEGPSQTDFYRNYYHAQLMFHQTGGIGAQWRAWNEPMREQLITQQEKRGHLKGSWWVNDRHNRRGGRLYATSLATMTLEVYYRYLPLYQKSAVETPFPE